MITCRHAAIGGACTRCGAGTALGRAACGRGLAGLGDAIVDQLGDVALRRCRPEQAQGTVPGLERLEHRLVRYVSLILAPQQGPPYGYRLPLPCCLPPVTAKKCRRSRSRPGLNALLERRPAGVIARRFGSAPWRCQQPHCIDRAASDGPVQQRASVLIDGGEVDAIDEQSSRAASSPWAAASSNISPMCIRRRKTLLSRRPSRRQ